MSVGVVCHPSAATKKMWSRTKPEAVNNAYRGPHAVVQRLGRLCTRPRRRQVVLGCPTPEHGGQFRSAETDRGICKMVRISHNKPPERTFLWPDFEFLDVHVRRVVDVVIGRTASPRQCQPPPSTRTTRVHPLSLNLPCLPKPTLPIAVRRILQEAKELANDESTDYTAAPLEVCHISSPLPRQTFTHLIPGRHICESYPTPCPFQSNLYSKIQGDRKSVV